MQRLKFLRAILALVFGFSFFACRSKAQSLTTGDIAGTVTDASGAVVPNAKVTLKNNAQGSEENASTNGAGLYRFSLLSPGKYTVTVKVSGFDSISRETVVNLG